VARWTGTRTQRQKDGQCTDRGGGLRSVPAFQLYVNFALFLNIALIFLLNGNLGFLEYADRGRPGPRGRSGQPHKGAGRVGRIRAPAVAATCPPPSLVTPADTAHPTPAWHVWLSQ
jgi:hypothetical protein